MLLLSRSGMSDYSSYFVTILLVVTLLPSRRNIGSVSQKGAAVPFL